MEDNPSFEGEIVLSWQEFCLGESVRVGLLLVILTDVSTTRANQVVETLFDQLRRR